MALSRKKLGGWPSRSDIHLGDDGKAEAVVKSIFAGRYLRIRRRPPPLRHRRSPGASDPHLPCGLLVRRSTGCGHMRLRSLQADAIQLRAQGRPERQDQPARSRYYQPGPAVHQERQRREYYTDAILSLGEHSAGIRVSNLSEDCNRSALQDSGAAQSRLEQSVSFPVIFRRRKPGKNPVPPFVFQALRATSAHAA